MLKGSVALVLCCLAAPAAGEFATSRFTRAHQRQYRGLEQRREGRFSRAFYFVVAADTQLGFRANNEGFAHESRLVTRLVRRLNRICPRPRALVIVGDMINMPAYSPKKYAAQRDEHRRLFARLRREIALVHVPGNHDVGSSPSRKLIEIYRRDFGDDYFTFWLGGVKGIVINSSSLNRPGRFRRHLRQQTRWLRRELKSAVRERPAHLFVFQHHPWYVRRPEEPDNFFSMRRELRRPWLRALQRAGARVVFSGHFHHNLFLRHRSLELLTVTAMGVPVRQSTPDEDRTINPQGVLLVEVTRKRVLTSYVRLSQIPRRFYFTRQASPCQRSSLTWPPCGS